MSTPIQKALGAAAWDSLPPALQAHYRGERSTDLGHLDIRYPRAMQPVLRVLRHLGALVHRDGLGVTTRVHKHMDGARQHWHRSLQWDDGQTIHFNSVWEVTDAGRIVEWVNPLLGLEMTPFVLDQALHYRGMSFVVQLGVCRLRLPEWLVLGHTTIVETAVDERHFNMDFRMTHPWFGEIFRYAGRFESSRQEGR